jgi:hypothetical protein
MVFNATFNNTSVISWWSVLLVEGTGENHWPAASHWQYLSHIVSSTPRHERDSIWFIWFHLLCLMPLSAIFQLYIYIMATSFSGGGSRSTRRELPTMGKQLVNWITCGSESSAPFVIIYKAGREPTLYWL